MTTSRELYLPPVKPRWARAKDLVAALGCTLVRKRRGRGRVRGDAPQPAQLCRDGRIFWPEDIRLDSRAWAYIAHEAVHHHVGAWSLTYEQPMLPFELELMPELSIPTLV